MCTVLLIFQIHMKRILLQNVEKIAISTDFFFAIFHFYSLLKLLNHNHHAIQKQIRYMK